MVRNLVKALVVPQFYNRDTSIGKGTNVATAMERLIIVPIEKIRNLAKRIFTCLETLVMTMDNFWLNPMDFYCFNVF